MKNWVVGRIAAVSVVAVSAAAFATPAMAGEKIANSYICVFKKDAVAKPDVSAKANAAARAHGGAVSHTYRNTIRGFSANISEAGMNAMRRANPNIAYCEQDQVMSIVVQGKGKPGGGGTAPSETTPPGITRVGGGSSTAFTGRVFVIDTGIDLDHPELNVNVGDSRSFARETDPNDLNGHGSHVSGTIGARKGNGIGVVGVAPGVELVAVKVLNRNGSGANSGVIAGVDYVGSVGQTGDVANMSLGGSVSTALDQAVVSASAKVKFALAAGNESDNANNHSPGRANGPNIYTISAVDRNDNFASFSNYGNPPVDYAEPGVSIFSTYKDGGYATLSGTSMATPHMAGLLVLGGIRTDGTANLDPDGNPDPIGHH